MVKLTEDEHEALRARADAENVPMASILRAGIEQSPATDNGEAPTRGRVLALLAEAAEAGNVAAMVALERALRLDSRNCDPAPDPEARVAQMLSIASGKLVS